MPGGLATRWHLTDMVISSLMQLLGNPCQSPPLVLQARAGGQVCGLHPGKLLSSLNKFMPVASFQTTSSSGSSKAQQQWVQCPQVFRTRIGLIGHQQAHHQMCLAGTKYSDMKNRFHLLMSDRNNRRVAEREPGGLLV